MKLFSRTGKERKEVPIIYQLGWWAHQHLLEIREFDVVVLESSLNLLNSKSLISYTVKGILSLGNTGVPYIASVHHNEQLLKKHDVFADEGEENTVDACIQITPIVGVEGKMKGDNTPVAFELTNQYVIHSLHWGDNRMQFVCGGIYKELCLKQRK